MSRVPSAAVGFTATAATTSIATPLAMALAGATGFL